MKGQKELFILMYHQLFTDKPCDRYSVSVDNFVSQMRWLSAEGFKTILPGGSADPGEGRSVMITFDDGYESDFTRALPVMSSLEFRGVSFITTSYVGRSGYLTWEQLARLRDAGFSIQSHTHTHQLLELCPSGRRRYELAHSKKILESRLNIPVTCVSLPGGSCARHTGKEAQEAGYACVFSSIPGVHRGGAVPGIILPRFCVDGNLSMADFTRLFSREGNAAAAGIFFKDAAKRILGRRLYHYFWRCFGKHARRNQCISSSGRW